MAKRIFDLVFAAIALVILSPFFLFIAVLLKIETRGPVIFRQTRVGKGFVPFALFKFRTMTIESARRNDFLASTQAHRITRVGKFLRATKIDELPQLLNVLRGEMSIVGPRPEVREYVEIFKKDYEEILKVRPGMTDLASLEYIDEERILGSYEKPEEAYIRLVLPRKIYLAKEYIERANFFFDMGVIARTLLKIIHVPIPW